MRKLLTFLLLCAWTAAIADPTAAGSTTYEASHVFKASPGRLIWLTVYNSKGTAQFVQIFNSATVPADTAVPLATFTVAASSSLTIILPARGLPCTTGISVSNSSTGPTKTIGSADCFFTAITDSF